MFFKILIVFCISIAVIYEAVHADKVSSEILNNYSAFFNFGEKKLVKLEKENLENSILKSKVEVLGEVLKTNIDSLKAWKKLDMIFLIDASSSVGEKNFQSELKFVKKLLSDVIVDYNHTRIAIVTFSSKNNVIKNVDEITAPRQENNKCLLLNKELNEIQYTGGDTYTLGAFQLAQKIFDKSRNESKKVLFLITDGFSNGGDPVPLAAELKKNKVTIFTIGIKNGNYKELYELSTSPGELYSYLLDSFQEFESLARRALHVDIRSGDYVPLGTNTPCNKLCAEGNCCDKNALCTCGTSTGHYSCICQPGYYGSGLQNSCSPCPDGSYADGPNLCLPCPDIHHTTTAPASSIESCSCKAGFQATKDHRCEGITCPKLSAPEHGYFVKRKDCGTVLNNACGVRCEVGYTLTGSSIRLCQENSNWSGNQTSCQVKTCPRLLPPLHGSMSCFHVDLDKTYNNSETHLPVDTVCSFSCEKGRTLIGSPQRTCLPLAQWDGLRTSCKQIKCSKLSSIAYGKVEPQSCTTSKQAFAKNCSYSCQDGFSLLGPSERRCTAEHGAWSDRDNQTTCQDITPPVLACPKNIKGNVTARKSFGYVSWDLPNVTDNSGLNVTLWLKPAIKNITNFKFKIGVTNVTYFAQDAFENMASCTFTVEILDNEVPTIENCIDPYTFLSTEQDGANVTWDEPNIFDNSGNVTVNKSHEFGFFRFGTTAVTYVATDPFNNSMACVLNITIEVSQCMPLPDPIFGRSECTSLSNGLQCLVTCQEGYAIPLTTPLDTVDIDNGTSFLCEHHDPIWYSQDNTMFPDCSVTEIPTEILQNGTISIQQESESDICNDTSKLNELENSIRNDLHLNIEDTCLVDAICNVNTTTVCDDEEESEYEELTNRIIKRAVLNYNKLPTNKTKRRKKQRINVKFQVNVKVNNRSRNADLSSFINVKDKYKSMRFLEGNSIGTVVDVKVNKPRVICPPGFVRRKVKCVQCPKGTFHNTTKNGCQSCALGYYNDKVGQASCIICPINHSTRKMHTKHLADCKAHCPPGTYARRKKLKPSKHHPNTVVEHLTLMPECRSCPIGHYQSNYGQLTCRPCPTGYTTLDMHSNSIKDCVPTVQEICANNSSICNKGRCTVDSDFYYSCSCDNKYIGSHCETRLSACSSNPCLNNGICTPQYNSVYDSYLCRCKMGFSGRNCQDIEEECIPACRNNGICTSTDNESTCLCPKGYGGESCQFNTQYCSRANICENNGKCVEDYSSFKCVCENGYIGSRCNLLPCDYQPCSQNMICINLNLNNATKESYRCQCPEGLQGPTCEDVIDYCKDEPCENNGVCTSHESNFNCECPKPFYGPKCEHQMWSDYILYFPRSGTTDFVKMDGFKDNLTELSVCFWMETLDNFNYGTILSYATYDYDNAFTLTDYTGLVVYINNQHLITDVMLNDGFWHFLCLTWENIDGTYNIYLDGKRVQNGTGLATGTTIQGGGKMVIGQEQDVLGGRFSETEAFLGKLTYLDIWKKVLRQSEIERYKNTCSDGIFGDLYAWPEIKNYIYGDIQVKSTTFCKTCDYPAILYNGLIDIKNNVAYYQCIAGYELSHPQYVSGRKCTKATKWEGREDPVCKKSYCGHPSYFKHGQIIGKNYYFQNKVSYVCNDGFTLVGESTRVCTENGTWSPERPSCLGISCNMSNKPQDSSIDIVFAQTDEDWELKDATFFDVGTKIQIVCSETTQLVGEDILTCMDNGTWNYPLPVCKPQIRPAVQVTSCSLEEIPNAPENGYTVIETLYAVGNGTSKNVEYRCRNGYKLNGDNYSTCIIDGYWTEPNISCDPITCGKPSSFRNMKIEYADILKNTFQSGNMVEYKCADGYNMFGNNIIRCLTNGRWTRVQGKCLRKSCYKPVVSERTRIEGNSYLFLDKVSLVCPNKARYILKCDSNGEWTGERDESC